VFYENCGHDSSPNKEDCDHSYSPIKTQKHDIFVKTAIMVIVLIKTQAFFVRTAIMVLIFCTTSRPYFWSGPFFMKRLLWGICVFLRWWTLLR